jgi:hypothetical protein
MNQNFEKLLSSVPTDVSGKWISVENVKILLTETIEQCCDCIRAVDAYNIKDHFGIKDQ